MTEEDDSLKIGLVVTRGGHIAEMERLVPAFEDHETFWVVHLEPVPEKRSDAYRIGHFPYPPLSYAKALPRILKILRKESPDVLISTGSQVAIPFFFVAKLLGIHTIFVESVCRTESLSVTGKITYYLADEFYVQWEDFADKLGPKAQYAGSIL